MNVVVFGDGFTFPEGDASTNRVHTYAKGLIENGVNVNVICFGNDYTTAGDDETNGIRYFHPFGQSIRNKQFIIRRWQKFIKYFKTFSLFRKINKNDKISVIVVYSLRVSNLLFAWVLSKMTGASLVKECSEHPLIHYQNGTYKKISGKIKLFIETRLVDGIFCISRFLTSYFRANGVPEKKLFLIPSTVDPERFNQKSERPLPFPYVGYFGGLTFERDNVDVLMKAFAEICDKHPDTHLVLGGFCTESDKKKIENLIFSLKLPEKIILLKYLPREEITRYITHSKILVMVRGKILETEASFPSKLTEYLSTSKPVITVSTGEIPEYISDKVNAFLVEAGNCSQLAEKIDYILNNYDFSLQVARKGKELTETVFNYRYQSERMVRFIETI